MEVVTKLAWGFLALIHASPAAVLFAPSLVKRLWGIEANGALGVLLDGVMGPVEINLAVAGEVGRPSN